MFCQTSTAHTLNLPHSGRYTACGTGHLTPHPPTQLENPRLCRKCRKCVWWAVPTLPRAPSGLYHGLWWSSW